MNTASALLLSCRGGLTLFQSPCWHVTLACLLDSCPCLTTDTPAAASAACHARARGLQNHGNGPASSCCPHWSQRMNVSENAKCPPTLTPWVRTASSAQPDFFHGNLLPCLALPRRALDLPEELLDLTVMHFFGFP